MDLADQLSRFRGRRVDLMTRIDPASSRTLNRRLCPCRYDEAGPAIQYSDLTGVVSEWIDTWKVGRKVRGVRVLLVDIAIQVLARWPSHPTPLHPTGLAMA